MIDYRRLSWWLWLATVGLLTAGLAGWTKAFALAIALSTVNLAYFWLREREAGAFPVQVRIAYLGILAVAYLEPIRFLYWVPFTGTWAMVLFGYCPLARTISLMPWNRSEPMSLALLKRTFLSTPVKGSVLQGLPAG
jgi:hypothetical protein